MHLRILSLITVFLVLSTLLLFWVLRSTKQQTLKTAVSQLRSTLSYVDKSLNKWAEERKIFTRTLAESPQLLKWTKAQQSLQRNIQNLKTSPEQIQVRAFFKDKLKLQGDLGIFVICKNGQSLFSMRDQNIGTQNIISLTHPELFQAALEGKTVIVPPMISDVPVQEQTAYSTFTRWLTMFIVSPIRDTNDSVIAVFSLRLDPIRNFSYFAELGRSGETGETYLFDDKGLLLTESRFNHHLENAGLLQSGQRSMLSIYVKDPGYNLLTVNNFQSISQDSLPLTFAAQTATQKISGQRMKSFRDYRGVCVLGAWKWNSLLNVGITSEIDEDEVMSSYQVLQWTIILVFSGLVVLAIILAYMLISTELNLVKKLSVEKKKAEDANDLKDKFVSLVSHDLRSPLTSIGSYAELSQEPEITEEERHQYQKRIKLLTTNMADLIGNVLEATRMKSDKMVITKSRFRLDECIERILLECTVKIDMKKLEIKKVYPKEAELFADPTLLEEVIKNLITNSIKFSNEGGYISIDLAQSGNSTVITIKDNGIGIPENRQKKLFDYYEKTSTQGTAGELGTGMGLPLCKDIVTAHGGTITLDSVEKEGTTFLITLPGA
ncbi:MAG: sensor histidine kinase [Fibrobacteria bacterium]|nr:sensor histidine kinase [Fibrobacteria bacterium]